MFGYIINGDPKVFKTWFTVSVIAVVVLAVLAFYLLRSLALYKMAKNSKDEGVKSLAFLAWIPCIWVYVAGKLAGRVNFFGNEVKSFALIATIIVSIAEVLNLAYSVLSYYPIISCILNGETVYFEIIETATESYAVLTTLSGDIPSVFSPTMQVVIDSIGNVGSLAGLLSTVMLIFIWIALFKKYWPQHYTLATILCIIGCFPIVIFCIRNRQPIDFEAFIRDRYQRMYNQNGYYGGNRNGQNNFNQGADNRNGDNVDPFENLNSNGGMGNGESHSSDGDDPFADFNKKN